jgi:hypothetical protein
MPAFNVMISDHVFCFQDLSQGFLTGLVAQMESLLEHLANDLSGVCPTDTPCRLIGPGYMHVSIDRNNGIRYASEYGFQMTTIIFLFGFRKSLLI